LLIVSFARTFLLFPTPAETVSDPKESTASRQAADTKSRIIFSKFFSIRQSPEIWIILSIKLFYQISPLSAKLNQTNF
jgi:hypothetical protein